MVLLAGCVYHEGAPDDDDVEGLVETTTWISVPEVGTVGARVSLTYHVQESATSWYEVEDSPPLSWFHGAIVASRDPQARPGTAHALSCMPFVDLQQVGEATTHCEFEEPGMWYLRSLVVLTWGGLNGEANSVRSWSDSRRILVLPAVTVTTSDDAPGLYDPASSTVIPISIAATTPVSGEVEVRYVRGELEEDWSLASFSERCPAAPFSGSGTVAVTCDWRSTDRISWIAVARISTASGEHLFPEGQGGRSIAVHKAHAQEVHT